MSKHFLLNPEVSYSSKEDVVELEKNTLSKRLDGYNSIKEKNAKVITNLSIPLKHTVGRVIVTVNLEYKNSHRFEDGTEIYIGRDFNNLNRRETQPVNAIVISAENIPKGAEVLVHHNCFHDTNKIFDCEDLIEGETSNDVQYFSIKENECFLWRKDTTEWQPCTIFETALRVFKPYEGVLENIEPTKLKDVLFVTSGELKGKCVSTLKNCDYEIIFLNENGVEQRVIRFRPFGDKENQREEEATCVLNDITEKVNNGELLIGLNTSDCNKFKSDFIDEAEQQINSSDFPFS